MILFHVPRVDSGDLRLWRRVLLPAYLLRRAGVPAKIIAGEPKAGDFTGAAVFLAAGAITGNTARHCRLAREAGLRVLVDIGDMHALAGGPGPLRAAAAVADALTASDDAVADAARRGLGSVPIPVDVLPDPVGVEVAPLRLLAAFPGICLRVLADSFRIRTIDLARRLRRRILDGGTPAPRRPLIVWFGDAGDLNEAGGLGELLLAAGALTDLAEAVPFRLRAVGTSRQLFRRTVARLPVATEFRRLTLASLARDIRGADLCFLPVAGDSRAEIARRLGVAVFAPPLGAPDWESQLRAQLSRRGPQAAAPQDNAPLQAWVAALARIPARPPITAATATPDGRRQRVVFLLQQFQDLDLICPLAEAAITGGAFEVQVAVLTKIAVPASRRLDAIRAGDARITFWRSRDVLAGRIGLAPGSVDVVVTASDGGGPGSRCAAAFVRQANAIGAATLNLQHGLDNGGLTYGEANPHKKEQFASRYVLTWGGFERLTSSANADTRTKVIPVGCPKRRLARAEVPALPVDGRPIIAVFENLHWRRYDDAYRQRFVADLIAAARAAPDLLFVLKPHMGGRWFTQARIDRSLPSNLMVADPETAPWRRFTADAFLAQAAAVITTPSTIALDAARYELPVALVAYGIEADNYAPLPRLERAEDWSEFVRQVRSGEFNMAPVRAFREAAMLPGDAVARCLAVIRLAGAGRSQSEIVAALDAESRA
jgi:hypothetical protein